MLKKVENTIVNLMLFWVIVSTTPGVTSQNGSIGYLIGGFIYGVLIVALPEVLRFFKFPKNFWGRLLIGTGLTFLLLLTTNALFPRVLELAPGFVGRFDFIWFTAPKLFELPSVLAVSAYLALLLNVCSIILDFLKKGKV